MTAGKPAKPGNGPAANGVEDRLPPHKLVSITKLVTTDFTKIELRKLNEIADLLWLPAGLDDKEKNARIIKALDLFESIKPEDGVEAMLAVQMVGTHHAATECLRRAMVPAQSFEGRTAALQYAQRLMSLYIQQLAALDKHRGKGQQKITVERVQVAPGGQAIVGHVQTYTGQPAAEPAQVALEAPQEDSVPLPGAKERARRKAPR